MTTAADIKAERERREAVARERAAQLPPGDYYASSRFVMRHGRRTPLVECETHSDAVMVMLAAPNA